MNQLTLQDSPKARILIRAANWVGDAIMTTPVIRAVRINYPQAHITVLAKPWVVPVYETNPHVDEVMVYENTGRHRMVDGTLIFEAGTAVNRFSDHKTIGIGRSRRNIIRRSNHRHLINIQRSGCVHEPRIIGDKKITSANKGKGL